MSRVHGLHVAVAKGHEVSWDGSLPRIVWDRVTPTCEGSCVMRTPMTSTLGRVPGILEVHF